MWRLCFRLTLMSLILSCLQCEKYQHSTNTEPIVLLGAALQSQIPAQIVFGNPRRQRLYWRQKLNPEMKPKQRRNWRRKYPLAQNETTKTKATTDKYSKQHRYIYKVQKL